MWSWRRMSLYPGLKNRSEMLRTRCKVRSMTLIKAWKGPVKTGSKSLNDWMTHLSRRWVSSRARKRPNSSHRSSSAICRTGGRRRIVTSRRWIRRRRESERHFSLSSPNSTRHLPRLRTSSTSCQTSTSICGDTPTYARKRPWIIGSSLRSSASRTLKPAWSTITSLLGLAKPRQITRPSSRLSGQSAAASNSSEQPKVESSCRWMPSRGR